MSAVIETGHAKNIANLDEIIRRCILFGPVYNPTDAWIQVTALQTKSADAKTALAAAKDARTAYDQAINARAALFDNLRKLATRVVNAFEAARVPARAVDDLKVVNRKLTGKRAPGKSKRMAPPPVTAPEGGTEELPGTHSVSHQSFDALMDHFDQVIRVVSSEPLYLPNEAELQPANLTVYLNEMRTANDTAQTAAAVYDKTMHVRDAEMYNADTGILDLAKHVKKYVKSLFGAKSNEYEQIASIKFT